MSEAVAIGIDLGTTFSCVAFVKDGEPRVCHHLDGTTITPSWVYIGDRERLVGQAAKNKAIEDIDRVIFDAKRLIGRDIDDEVIQADREKWPFELVEEAGQLKIKVKVNGRDKSFYPHEISGMVLNKMKKCAEDQIGRPIEYAVITVPAYFTDAQRHATIMAGSFANLKILRIINEPTAAAFAYNLMPSTVKDKTILVYDLGGGTFDVTILKLSGKNMRVLATNGDNHLGGEDFDNNMVDHCIGKFENQFKCKMRDINQRDAKIIIRRMKNSCEKAKIELSSAFETTIIIDSIYGGNDFSMDIPRARFESFNNDLFERTIEILNRCLEDAKLKIEEVNHIVLVGGSTRIPKVKDKLTERFPNTNISNSLHPDEAVAQGAAIFADILLKAKLSQVKDDTLVDVTPLSLGIESEGGLMSVIVPRNTPLPTQELFKTYSNVVENQESMMIKVYEGERTMVEDNNLLGEFELRDIPKGPKGHIKIEVRFMIDANNILIVTASEKSSQQENKIVISNKGRLTLEEIERLKKDAEENKSSDEDKRDAAVAKSHLVQYCENMKMQINAKKPIFWISDELKMKMLKAFDDTLKEIELQPAFKGNWFITKKEELETNYRASIKLE